MALVNGQNFGYCIYLIVSSGYTAFFSSCHVAYILAKFHISLFSLVLLRSKIPSGKCAKLHTMAASNDRDHL